MNKVMATKSKAAKAAVKKLPKEVSVEAAAEAKLLAENGHHAQGGFSTNVVADDASGGGNGGVSPVVILGGLVAAGGIAAAAAGGGGEKVIVQPVPTPVPAPTPAPVPAPVYTVTAAATSVDEGSTIRFTISGTNAAGKVVSYQLTGSAATAADTSTPLTGTVTLDSNGKAYVDVVVSADKLTEGAEKLNLVLSGGEKVAADVTVNDTSLTPPPAAQTFTLTTSVDTGAAFTGGTADDTFNGVVSATSDIGTFTDGDSLVGGGGNDTLNVTIADSASDGAQQPVIFADGIETLAVTNNNGVATTLSAAQFVGLKTVKVTGGLNSLTVADSKAVLNAELVSTNKSLTLTAAGTAAIGDADSASVTLNGVATTGNVTVTNDDVENLNVTLTGSASGSSTAGTAVTLASDELETVVVSGSASARLVVDLTGADAATQTGVFDASLATGAITATITKGASGKLSVTGGSGNDTLTIVNGVSKDMTVAGGEGTDTLVSAGDYSSTTAAANQVGVGVTGFEKVNAGGGIVDQRAFANNTFVESVNAGTYEYLSASFTTANISTNGTVTIDRATDTDADTLAVKLTAASDGTSTITAAEEEKISINAGGLVAGVLHTVALSAEDLTELTVTGSNALTITGLADAVALKTVDASAHTGATFSVDASASNVAMTIKGSAGVPTASTNTTVNTLTGGSKGDSITGGDYKDVINGGNGNDTIVGGAGNDSIDGGSGADVIDAGEGNNTVIGGLGDDSITAGAGNDTITVNSGDDTVTAGAGNDILYVSDLDDEDSFDGGTGTDRLRADAISDADAATAVGAAAGDFVDVDPDAALQLKNIETLHLQVTAGASNSSAATGEVIDFTDSSGLGTLNLDVVDGGDAYLTVKNFDGTAVALSEVAGGSNTSAARLTIDGVGQDLTVTLKQVGYTTTVADGDLVITGVDELTIAASSQYTNALGSAVNIANYVEDIVADTASKVTIQTGATTAANTAALVMSGTVSANDAETLVVSVGNNTTMVLGDVSSANDEAASLSITVGQDATLITGGGANDDVADILEFDLADANLDTVTIDVGVGGTLQGALTGAADNDVPAQMVLTADTIDALTVTVGAAATFRADINAGAVGTITGSTGSTLDITTIGAASQDSDITITGRGSLNAPASGGTALIALVGADFAFDLSGWTDTNSATTTFDIDGSALTGDAIIKGSLVEINDIETGAGDDNITGGAGNDIIVSADGDDTISGGSGNDSITGGAGNDSLVGGLGADTLVGGKGADIIKLGASDTAVDLVKFTDTDEDAFYSTSAIVSATTVLTGVDLIYDLGNNDTINVAGLVADGSSAATTVGTSIGATLSADAVNLVRGSYSTTTGIFTAGTASTDDDYLLQVIDGGATDGNAAVVLMNISGTVSATISSSLLTFTIT